MAASPRPGPSGCQQSNEIAIHNNLKNHLHEWLNDDQLKQLKEQFRKDPLTERDIKHRIADVFDLFDRLMEYGTIAVGDYKALVKKLKRTHRQLATHVENEEKKIRDIQNGGPSPVKLQRTGTSQQYPAGNPSIDVPTANTSHALKIHPNLQPMIDTTKARVTEEIKKSFIDTRAFRDGKEKLQKNRIAVLKGNTGDGKTSTAIRLLHWLSQEQHNRQPLQLHNIKHLDLLAPSSKTVIFIDDIFGEKDLREKEVQEWNKRVNSVIPNLCGDDPSEANFILITVRNEIFNSLKTHSLADVFTDVNIVDLSADTYQLTEEEKKQFLELYKPSEFSWEKEEKEEIVKCAPNIGFPQCCRIFRDVPEVQKDRVKFFQNPFHFFKSALSRSEECPALLFLFLNNGMIKVKDLDPYDDKVNETLLLKSFKTDLFDGETDRTMLEYEKKVSFIKDSLDRLSGFLVVKEKHWLFDYEVYRFYHDSIYVTVALLYGDRTLVGYIKNCPRTSLSYLTTSKTSANMIVISSDHYTCMCDRLLREFVCKEKYYGTSIGALDVWKDPVFVEEFVSLLNERKADKLDMLNKACTFAAEECALYLLCEGVKPDNNTLFCVVRGGSVSLLHKLLQNDIQYNIIPTRRDENNYNVLHEACWYGREEMMGVLCDTYPHLLHDTYNMGQTPLHVVAETGNCSMFQTVERIVLKSLCRVEDEQHKCETVDGRVVHRSCACSQYMSQLVDPLGQTVLHVSCMSGHREIYVYLCETFPALTTAVDIRGQTVLHASCMRRHREVCVYLCETFPALTKAVDNDGQTVLHVSCRSGHREVCVYLCETFPVLTTAVDNGGHHCLHYIARYTSDVDMFTECESHVKQYIESSGGEYDITTILDREDKSVLDYAKERTEWCKNNRLYDHLVKVFGK